MHIRQSDCARCGEVWRDALNRRNFLAAAGGGALGLSVAGFACAEEIPAIAYESVPNVLSLRAIKTETVMSIIDQALKANELYAKTYDPKWGKGPPRPQIVVVTCMDPRLSDLPGILGLERADIDVIRTGGPNVTGDVLAELVVSTRVLGSKEIMLINHTGCGFSTFTDAELNAKFSKLTGDTTPTPMRFFAFKDPEQQTKDQIKMVRSHPWISKDVPVRGFIFDVDTGRLREVLA